MKAKSSANALVHESEGSAPVSSPKVSAVAVITKETEHNVVHVVPTHQVTEKAGKKSDMEIKVAENSEEGWSTPTRLSRSPRKGIVLLSENFFFFVENEVRLFTR